MTINQHTSPARRRRITAAAVVEAGTAATGPQSGAVPGRSVGDAKAARKQR